MKSITVCFSLIVLAASAFAQTERQILVTPNAEHPQAAKDSGLGGTVTVYVTVDQAGNVVSVGDVTGPGMICPSVTRADVVALRESARAAAVKAKFAPSADPNTSVISLNFNFPRTGSESNVYTFGTTAQSDGQRQSTAANPLPSDYTGPVYNTSNAPTDYTGPVLADSGSRPIASGVRAAASPVRIPKQISGGVLNGKARSLPKPPYPPAARAVRASGAVSIQVLIDEDGTVFSAAPVSGHPLLRSASRLAACKASFSPTLLMGNPVKVSGVITYNFVP